MKTITYEKFCEKRQQHTSYIVLWGVSGRCQGFLFKVQLNFSYLSSNGPSEQIFTSELFLPCPKCTMQNKR